MSDQRMGDQPPAGYIWPPGFYPIYKEHSLNLLAAEKYVEGQQMRAQRAERMARHRAEGRARRHEAAAARYAPGTEAYYRAKLRMWAFEKGTGLAILIILSAIVAVLSS